MVDKKNEIGFYYKPHYFIDGIPVTYRLYAHRGLWKMKKQAGKAGILSMEHI